MREIKFIGNVKRGSDKRNYNYSIFKCPHCRLEVEKKTKDGLNAKFCSHNCYAENRTLRGAYKDNVLISGYRYKYSPNHPSRTNHNYVAEHRLVAEEMIGRELLPGEVVHHKDGDKLNNVQKNLLVLTNSEHIKLHLELKKRGSNGKFTI